MDEQLKLSDFDILGIIELSNVQGIEKYVTKMDDRKNKYLSRSKEYYNIKTLSELSEEREYLKEMIMLGLNKRNFVILENMLNCSGKVYFKKFEEFIMANDTEKSSVQIEMEQAKKCLLEDTTNIVKIMSGSSLISIDRNLLLPKGNENSLRRPIEMDNKGLLYLFSKSLDFSNDYKDVQVLTPGYGSIYIGPFLNVMHGCNFTNILKSKYIEELNYKTKDVKIEDAVSNQDIFKEKKQILLIDDNIGTGQTMNEIKQQLVDRNINNFISGAIQYNWRNYYRTSIGEKDIPRFNVGEYEILTQFNYAGHKLYKHAIDNLLSSSGEYIKYLNSKAYKLDGISDLEGVIFRGMKNARRTGLELDEKYEREDTNFTPEMVELSLKYNNTQPDTRELKPETTNLIKRINEISTKLIEREKGVLSTNDIQSRA